jgi:O-antigen ligase
VIKKRLLGFIILSVSSVATIRYVLSKGLLAPLILKLTLSTSSSSATDRVQRWSTASELVSINPLFGTGLGNLSSKGYASPVNWFMFISVEAGIIALFLFISFVFVKWLKLSYSRRNLDKYILFGLSASMVHLFATSGFHYPYILLLLVINRLNHFRDESIIPSK